MSRTPSHLVLALTLAAAAGTGQLRCQIPDPARFTEYGTSCGPVLIGSDVIQRLGHQITFRVDSAIPGAPVALLIGGGKLDLPILGTKCRLLTDAFASLPLLAGATGSAQITIPVPGDLQGLVFAQALPFDVGTGTILSSKGLEVLLPGVSPTPDPVTLKSYPCYYIQSFNWNYGGDGVGVVTGKIRWPSSTCNAADGPPADRPVLIFTHGNGMTHNDHDYLMAHLARNGFVTVSVANGNHMGGSNEGRARQAISFLNSLHAFWGWSSRLSDKVAFAGHSRGGEAAVTAARLLGQNPSMGHIPYSVRAVISIAPTDGGGDNSDPKESLRGYMTPAFLGIYGSKDPDVCGKRLEDPLVGPENTVFAIYDRAGSESSSEGILFPAIEVAKSLVFIHGASHTGFMDTCNPVTQFGVTCTEHHDIAKGYFNAFLRWRVFGETAYRDYFDGSSTPTTIRLSDVELFTQFADMHRRVVDNFEQGGWAANTIGGSVLTSGGIAQIAEDELWKVDNSAPHDTRGVRIKWKQSPVGTTAWQIPNKSISGVGNARDVTPFRYLSLRVAQNYKDAWNVEGEDQDFYVQLQTGGGWSSKVKISSYGRIPYPDKWVFTPLNGGGLGDYSKSALGTVRLPLEDFAGADLTDVRAIYFYFTVPGHTSGSINVDSLQFEN